MQRRRGANAQLVSKERRGIPSRAYLAVDLVRDGQREERPVSVDGALEDREDDEDEDDCGGEGSVRPLVRKRQ